MKNTFCLEKNGCHIISISIFMYPGLRYADKKNKKKPKFQENNSIKKLLAQENNRIKKLLLFRLLTSKTLGHCWNIKN